MGRPLDVWHTLGNGESLQSGEGLFSANGGYRFLLQSDGNLLLCARFGPGWTSLWESNTHGRGIAPFRLSMQSDNNLVLFDGSTGGGKAVWDSGSAGIGQGRAHLTLQDDGNCVLYDERGKALWCTRTDGPMTSPYWGQGHRL